MCAAGLTRTQLSHLHPMIIDFKASYTLCIDVYLYFFLKPLT